MTTPGKKSAGDDADRGTWQVIRNRKGANQLQQPLGATAHQHHGSATMEPTNGKKGLSPGDYEIPSIDKACTPID